MTDTIRFRNLGEVEAWLGNESMSIIELRLVVAWMQARGYLSVIDPDGPFYLTLNSSWDEHQSLTECLADVAKATAANCDPVLSEDVARLELQRFLDRHSDDQERIEQLTEEFLVPVNDDYGSHVGRDPVHGVGVTTPYYEWIGDAVSSRPPFWVTVYADGTVTCD